MVPTAHYQMGGDPDQLHGAGRRAREGTAQRASSRASTRRASARCVSVHGANRLGTNSLLDLLVFGKASGEQMIKESCARPRPHRDLPKDAGEPTLRAARAAGRTRRAASASTTCVNELRRAMQAHCGVFRFPDDADRGRREDQGDRRASEADLHRRTRARSSTPRASRRSSSTTWSRSRARRSCRPRRARKAAARTTARRRLSRSATTRTG